jgi:uncharacterized protein (TIGR00369 family)
MKAHSEKLTPLAHTAHNRCFGCGPANPSGLHLDFMIDEEGRIVCLASVPDTFEGPRGFVHGGIIATLLDETMSKAVRSHNVVAMTRHMEVDYRRPVPCSAQIRLEGRVFRHEGRKHWAEASILDEAGTVLAHSKGLFVEVRRSPDPPAVTRESAPHG